LTLQQKHIIILYKITKLLLSLAISFSIINANLENKESAITPIVGEPKKEKKRINT